jgi:hypothetical protein
MKEKIISGAVANWFSIGVLVAVGIVVFPIYLFLYGWQSMDSLIGGLLMAFGIIVAIVAHELIHGLFFCIFTKDWHSVTFGFNRQFMAPYTHCDKPITCAQYRVVTAMPTIVLGILPLFLAFLLVNPFVLIFGFIMTAGGAGDILVIWVLRKFPNDTLILDHPSKIGFMYEEKEEGKSE